MLGAIVGDVIGSRFEFNNTRNYNFKMFSDECSFTDDTICTVAIMDAIVSGKSYQEKILEWCRQFPHPMGGYGVSFAQWLRSENPQPYNSFGNGSAMRVSSVGWVYDNITRTREVARYTAEVTHNHPEGIKGAQAAASAIFLARTAHTKQEIKEYIVREFRYDVSRSCDEIRPGYFHVETCQGTVPEAITAFLEGNSFEDVIRTAVSLGGDSDTLTCIAGAMAEAYYGIPKEIIEECRRRLSDDFVEVINRAYSEMYMKEIRR